MSEEPPRPANNDENEARSDPIDIEKRETYDVSITGKDIPFPVNRIVELPLYLVEGFMQYKAEKVPTEGQRARAEELVYHLNEQFPAITENVEMLFTIDNVTIKTVDDTE